MRHSVPSPANGLGVDRQAEYANSVRGGPGRRRCTGGRLPARGRHPRRRVLGRRDGQRRAPAAPRDAAPGGRRLSPPPRRRTVRHRLRHVRAPAGVSRAGPARGLSAADRLPPPRRGGPPDQGGPDRPARGAGAVQQRPLGRQLHRRRSNRVDHRLRVCGQQRPVFRARQPLERVPPARRPARGAGGGLRRPLVSEPPGPGPPVGRDVAVRLDPVGVHPGRDQHHRFRLLELGDWRSTNGPRPRSAIRTWSVSWPT